MTARNTVIPADTRSDRVSPPTRRVIRILELLGAHPDRSWTLAEVARELGLVPSTALAILNELRHSALVVRDESDKSYTPGPALLALGKAADARFPALRALAHQLEPLSRSLGYGCSIHMRDHDELVMAHRFGPSERFVEAVIGVRYPFAPPFGLLITAWASDEDRAAWQARTPRVARHLDLPDLLAHTRRRGFGVEGIGLLTPSAILSVIADLDDDAAARPGRTSAPAAASAASAAAPSAAAAGSVPADGPAGEPAPFGPAPEDIQYGFGSIIEDQSYVVGLIGAPVFDSSGRTRFIVFLHLGGEALPGARVNAIGAALAARTAEATRRLHGLFPPDYPDWTSEPVRPASA
ncbi:DNA-binding transcriptional regulator, IclR family [Parafrankia irregularis]|uniref:DNA-binding transcriptional regulator, IclR family n=1 Tax=Parafrankia irregularis TaxID=795642 RepID=A0A0S4QMK9_9ACTN|nr:MULTISPECIES: helix-turn-helix domain-containing protein [Parafrankia]MBE3202350.1 helix-turn-helix domain-containing protein [Parafrankia sp. CH37]CUU56104.1 DNA-binding transcriptional regulator, IclR family [Parafrankia irregularis]